MLIYDIKYIKDTLTDWEDKYKIVELNPDFKMGYVLSEFSY